MSEVYEKRERVGVHGLQVDAELFDFIENEALQGLGIGGDEFWRSFAEAVNELGPVNRKLLRKRDELQEKIDRWHRENPSAALPSEAYHAFLKEIGYLVEEGESFSIETAHLDDEVSAIAGPQLVVPVTNERYALNAANARWGSLYDALYGTNAMDGNLPEGSQFDPQRGKRVFEYAFAFLDRAAPLQNGRHGEVVDYAVEDDEGKKRLVAVMGDGTRSSLEDPSQFAGYSDNNNERIVLLRNHGLHIELRISAEDPVGKTAPGKVRDIVLEAAITTIQDCEDSVAAVDAADKIGVYRNWLGLMKGDLSAEFVKGSKTVHRSLNPDRHYQSPEGSKFSLSGRSLLLVRNVGHLMTTDAVLDSEGRETPEGFLDAFVTSLCALHDLQRKGPFVNSEKGSVYIVKPKMHGPEEVAFACLLFSRVEDALGLDRDVLKIGIMDEERRTTVNLKECVRAAKSRVMFINTGFLDRTGDEIHTSMEAGPFKRKGALKEQPWLGAYENWNVDIGLECGMGGRSQIGKGMWTMPDEMQAMLVAKQSHPEAGASCAWVPSPTAATLHAMHYHFVDVRARQTELAERGRARIEDILTVPLRGDSKFTDEEIRAELENNAQGILGYVARWVEQGIGCSKVPDINDVGLMEDRATLRISSQHIANWLRHGICDEVQVMEAMKRMAAIVDTQNADDPDYRNMGPEYSQSIAFLAACDLVFKGRLQPNGYTEPILHKRRRQVKERGV